VTGLVRDGFLYSRQGGGSYVAEKPSAQTISSLSILDDSDVSDKIETGLHSGRLAGQFQPALPCRIYATNDVYVNLEKLSSPGNGIAWVRPSYEYYMAMQYLENAGIPQLLIGRNYGNFDFVTTDAKGGIRKGLEFLKEQFNVNTTALISERNNPDRPYIAERQIAFYQSCVELNLQIRDRWIFDFDTSAFSIEITRIGEELFLSQEIPEVIFTANFNTAVPLITFAEAHGKIPGRDFHILIFDNEPKLSERKGIYMLAQQWDKMEGKVKEWISLKKQNSDNIFKCKIEPELIGDKV
jgi:hypothetical protein